MSTPLERLRYHVTGAIERGEACAIRGLPADWYRVRVDADGSIAGVFSDLCDAERQVDVLDGAGEASTIQRRSNDDPEVWLNCTY